MLPIDTPAARGILAHKIGFGWVTALIGAAASFSISCAVMRMCCCPSGQEFSNGDLEWEQNSISVDFGLCLAGNAEEVPSGTVSVGRAFFRGLEPTFGTNNFPNSSSDKGGNPFSIL